MNFFADLANFFSVFFSAFYHFWWIFLPIILFYIFKTIWGDFAVEYSKNSWVSSNYVDSNYVLLEIVPPRDLEKSPKLIEALYFGMAGVTTNPTTFETWIKGFVMMDRFSLEMVGEEGKLHYYIRTMKKHRNLVESNIYAHFPDAEIFEVEDYVKKFPKTIPNRDWDIWGSDFKFILNELYPIRTYDQFEEDISGEMMDPVASMAEVIGTLTPGQHIWMQYVVEPLHEGWNAKQEHKKTIEKISKIESPESLGFLDHITDIITNIPKAFFSEASFKTVAKKEQQPLEFRLTPVEKDVLKAVQENLGRNTYKVKMRMVYLGKKKGFTKSYVSAFIGAIKQFNDMNLNSVAPDADSKTFANYVFMKSRSDYKKRLIYKRYRGRSMDGKNIYLSYKELATVFHFPDMSVKSPSISKVEAKKGSAPANLPF